MSLRPFLTLLAPTTLAALLAACGSNATSGGGGSAGSGGTTSSGNTGGATSSSSSTSSVTSSSSSSSSSTGTGTGGQVDCSTYTPTAPTPKPVSVRFLNMTGATMYIGEPVADCANNIGFDLDDPSGNALTPELQNCQFTCSWVQHQQCSCATGCGSPIVTLVAPGSYYEIPWTGTVFNSASMPASCDKDDTCPGDTCFIEVQAPAPPLTMSGKAWTKAEGCTGTCMDCTPGAGGTCIVNQATSVGGTEINGTVSWMGESKINVVFQ